MPFHTPFHTASPQLDDAIVERAPWADERDMRE